MARTFGGVSTDKVAVGNYAAINNLITLTISIWAYRTGNGGASAGRLVDKEDSGANGGFVLFGQSSNYSFVQARWGTQNGQWTYPNPTNSAWHHHCLTYDGSSTANDPVVRVDGIGQTVSEVAVPIGTLQAETQTFTIGNRTDSARNWAGALAHAAVWNVVLSDADKALLAKGVHPYEIQPANLVFYMPLWGNDSPEPNVASAANTGTVTGTVKFEEPPVGDLDTLTVGAAESVLSVVAVNVDLTEVTDSDAVVVQLIEAAAALNSFSVTAESSSVGLTESALTVVASLLSSDNATAQVTEDTTFSNETVGNESCAVQVSEGALSVPTTEQRTADSARVGLTETAQVAVFANGEDTVSLTVLEAEAFVSAVVSVFESLGCTLEEAADLVMSWSVSESVAVQVEEMATITDAPVEVSVIDACLVGCADTLAVASSQRHPRAGRTLREMIKPGHFQIRDYSLDSDKW